MTVVVVAAFILALIPALMIWINLRLYQPLPAADAEALPAVSLLIPARDEAARIGAAIEAALASRDVELEVIVLDDHSTDGTADVVQRAAGSDARLRMEMAPELPEGWCGKQHACHVLADRAHHDLLVFIDADVRLAPDALARIAAALHNCDAGLISGIPLQLTGTWAEKLLIPLIHFVLLGFLPIWQMRRSAAPSIGAGCGQLIAVEREAYRRAGGHAAIATSLHDGITLPRAFRNIGIQTDLFDATDIATCHMYTGAGEVWHGFAKNATEGMATPAALPIWSLLLGGGQVLPLIALGLALAAAVPAWPLAAAAVGLVYGARLALAVRFRQNKFSALLHPLGILALLAVQWVALINAWRGRPAMWRTRGYARQASK
jgi:hypothetical protein